MSWYKLFKKFNLGHMFKDVWYRLDWRKPSSSSVKKFLNKNVQSMDSMVKLHRIPKLKSNSQDQTVMNCLRWVKRSIKYEPDKVRFNTAEKWQTVQETLDFRKGDCEDGAILVYSLCVHFGVNPAQLALVCGDVVGGGHCWMEYQSDYKFPEWFTIDWCYWYSQLNFKTRVAKSDNYIKDWFRINHFMF